MQYYYLRPEVLQYSTCLLIITVLLSSSIALCSCSGNVKYFFFNVIYRYTVLKLYSNFHLLQYCTCPLMSCCQNPQINAIMHQHKQLQVITTTLPLQCLHQDCIPSQDGFHSLPGLGPRPYARRPKRTNRRPTVRLPSAFGPHKYSHLLSHS